MEQRGYLPRNKKKWENRMKKVLVALSGGVDSSVAAALLVEQGYEVVGATMRLWSASGAEQENRCCTPDSRSLAARLADKLSIPFTILDETETFRKIVVQQFLDGYARGETPNPCATCNRFLKWGVLWDYAKSIGADYLATGHYARVLAGPEGLFELYKGKDPGKDQTYFLSMLTQEQLANTLFPLGELLKTDVRGIAHARGLPAADQPESQDLCFLGERDYRDFLAEYAPETVQPGPITDRSGKLLGQHQGLAFYTIGQRKGLPAAAQALYVWQKDIPNNRLVVCPAEELGASTLRVEQLNWISGAAPTDEFQAEVKIRFRAIPANGLVIPQPNGSALVRFQKPIRDITPGQLAVFYQSEQVLGGGWIV